MSSTHSYGDENVSLRRACVCVRVCVYMIQGHDMSSRVVMC